MSLQLVLPMPSEQPPNIHTLAALKWTQEVVFMYLSVYTHTYVRIIKRSYEFEREWQGLQGEKGKRKCCKHSAHLFKNESLKKNK